MNHIQQLENTKYKNWVKGGLALKYLKDGLGEFADKVAKDAHNVAVQNVARERSCNSCDLKTLKPLHFKKSETTGKEYCPLSQNSCNCLRRNTNVCPNSICDVLYDEIVKSHVKRNPYWNNTNLSKWTNSPWEVAKCFINAPGYGNSQTAADTDVAGLLDLFRNHTHFQAHMPYAQDELDKMKKWRNDLFHSPAMELESQQLNDGISDIIEILQSAMELKNMNCAKKAVENLKALEKEEFIITTQTEAYVCRQTLAALQLKSEELKCLIQEASTQEKQVLAKLEQAEKSITESASRAVGTLQQEVDTIKERVDKLETEQAKLVQEQLFCKSEIQIIKQQMTGLEKELECLRKTEEQQKDHLKIIDRRAALQCSLLDYYQKNCVKTSVSPLIETKNNIEIADVYVQPNMVRDLREELHMGENTKVRIHNYSDIFTTEGRKRSRIYVVGDSGSGKSAFCKMMVSNWYKSKRPSTGNGDINVQTMMEFEFLFYIPLRWFSKKQESSIEEMIVKYYNKLKIVGNRTCSESSDIIRDILSNILDRCLILIDGLDEWKYIQDEFYREDETIGLPRADGLTAATIVTTSRPSAAGILKIKSSDYDCKIKLNGISRCSIQTMAVNYMSKIPKIDKNDMLHKLERVCISDLESTPLLLQQVIWLLCMGKVVGKSVTELYSNLVNIALRWGEKKSEGKQDEIEKVQDSSNFRNLSLPDQLNYYPSFKHHYIIIFAGSKIAFDVTINKSPVSFGRSELIERGIDENLLSIIKETGLLTETIRSDQTLEDSEISFTHDFFREYFAALHIASHNTSTYGCVFSFENTLHKLFGRYLSIQALLELEKTLIMVCGLAPKITPDVLLFVYKSSKEDGYYCSLRRKFNESFRGDPLLEMKDEYIRLANKCIDLIFKCLWESEVSGPSSDANIPVLDIVIDSSTIPLNMTQILKQTNPDLVHGLVSDNVCISKYVENILKFKTLQTLSLQRINLPHCQCLSLVEYISHTVTLRCIELSSIACVDNDIQSNSLPQNDLSDPNKELSDHNIDLSGHKQLLNLSLTSSPYIFLKINTSILENVSTDHVQTTFSLTDFPKLCHLKSNGLCLKHDELSDFVLLITRAVSLRSILLSDITCADHDLKSLCNSVFDLTNHSQLESLNATCSNVRFYNTNTSNLKKCSINSMQITFSLPDVVSLSDLDLQRFSLSHTELSEFATLLNRTTSLKSVKLCDIWCCEHMYSCTHDIDLSNHTQLRMFCSTHSEVLNINNLNTSNLEHCETDRTVLLDSIRNSVKIKTLSLSFLPYTREQHEHVLTLPTLSDFSLHCMQIDGEVLKLFNQIRELSYLELCNTSFTQKSWCTLVESLSEHGTSITVNCKWLNWDKIEENETARDYVKNNKTKFKFLNETPVSFTFETVEKTQPHLKTADQSVNFEDNLG